MFPDDHQEPLAYRYSPDPSQNNDERPLAAANQHGVIVTYTYDMPKDRPAKRQKLSLPVPLDWITIYHYDKRTGQTTRMDGSDSTPDQ